MLRGGQHVGDLPGIGDVVVQAGLDDQVDGLLAGDPEPGGVLAVAVAHLKSFSLNRRVLRREVALLVAGAVVVARDLDRRRSPDFRSEEHTSELQSLMRISYAVFCLKKKHNKTIRQYVKK